MNKMICQCVCHALNYPYCEACRCKKVENQQDVIFNTLESHVHLIEHAQEGIEKLFERIEKIEVYFGELKKLINKVYYQQGVLQGLDRRITELEKDYLD